MSKHTPGPWIFYCDAPSTDPTWHIVTTANRMRLIANVHIECPMELANALLIAAAPELLSACIAERLASIYDNDPGSHEANEAIKELVLLGYVEDGDLTPGEFAYALQSSAIAKATGEQA